MMKILIKMGVFAVGWLVSISCFAIAELHLEVNNQTNRELSVQKIDGKDNIELNQVQVMGDFPSKIGPHANKILAIKFDDGILTNITKDRASVAYDIICPNNLGIDHLSIVTYAYIIPNPRSISYGITVEKSLTGNHCTKLQNGNGSINIVDGQASITIIHS